MDVDVLWWLVPAAVFVIGAVIVVMTLRGRGKAGRDRPPHDPYRLGQDDSVSPHEASDRASGRNSWMRGGDGG